MPQPQDSVPAVSILIVAYNSDSVIGACLASIPEACNRHSYEVLLVDNGDGATAEFVRQHFPEVVIVPSKGNIGFAAGNNLLANSASGRMLLLLNPDVVLRESAIDLLLDASAYRLPGSAWGGVTLDENGLPDLGNTVHVPSLKEMASRVVGRSSASKLDLIQIKQDSEVEVLSGSFVLFCRDAWDEALGLDERFFLYCEEVDLFYRLAMSGHRFWRIAGSRGFHNIGHGEALTPTRMLYRTAGNMEFVRRHWSKPKQWLAIVFIWLGACQRLLVGKLIGWRWPRFKVVGDCHRDIAVRPQLWCNGYDPDRGLLARLDL